EEDLHVVHELPGDLHATLLTSRNVERPSLADVREAELREEQLAAAPALGLGDPPQHAVDIEVPLDGREVEGLALLDHSDPAPDILAIVGRVHAEDPQRPRG